MNVALIRADQHYLPLLVLPTDGSHPQPEDSASIESDLLSDETKLTILLEAAEDIRLAERDLREIDLLKARGVEGSGSLEGAFCSSSDSFIV